MANSQRGQVLTASIVNGQHRDPRGVLLTDVRISEFVIRPSSFFRHSSFKSVANPSRFWNRNCFLLLRLFGLLFPFLDAVVVDAAEREEFFLVVNHLFASSSG